MVIIKITADLVSQGARASITILLSYFSRNIPAQPPKGLSEFKAGLNITLRDDFLNN